VTALEHLGVGELVNRQANPSDLAAATFLLRFSVDSTRRGYALSLASGSAGSEATASNPSRRAAFTPNPGDTPARRVATLLQE
jgi:hypothetical protein